MNRHRRKFVRFKKSPATKPVNGYFKNVRGKLKKVYEKMKMLEIWRKTVMFVCVIALAIDPLFFFIPVIDSRRFCFTFDKKLGVAVCVLRTFMDTFYVIHIIFQFITEVIAPVPRRRVNLEGELILDSEARRKKRALFYFVVDIVSVLPIPQVVVLTLIQRKQRSSLLVTKHILKWVIIFHNIPRIIRIYPVFKEVTKASGTVTETKWIGAALNLLLYMLQSHVFGAFWYLGAIEMKDKCWREACAKTPGCNATNLYCGRGGGGNSLFLNTSCPLIEPGQITNSTVFNFGMYIDALKSGILESMDFPSKFFHCFWWGLRNLSALGQNLETSNSLGEIIFAIIICASGLLFLAVLIGNVQKYLQSTTFKVDEMEEEKRDMENWMSNRMIPEGMKKRIRRYKEYKWRKTRGTEEDALLCSLPKGLRIETKCYLYLDILKKVPLFEIMDDNVLDELCARLKTVLYTKNSYIVHEGEPVEEMLFIMRGSLISMTTGGGKIGFFNSFRLTAGGFCGEDLLTWALDPHSSHLPHSSRTVQALTEVEGIVLSADDIKFVATQFSLSNSKQIKHTFRFYSAEWRSWAAYYIQSVWKRHCRRKLSKALREEEGELHNTLHQNDDSSSGGNQT